MTNTVTVDENGIHNTVSVERATIGQWNAQMEDGTDQMNEMPDTEQPTNQDRIDKNAKQVFCKYLLKYTGLHVEAGNRRK